MFLDALNKDKKVQDWQFIQSDNAINLYIHHFLSKSGSVEKLSPGAITNTRNKFPDNKTIKEKIRETIRIDPLLESEKTQTVNGGE